MPFDKGKKRKLIDTCGHERCYSCMFRNEICPLCTRSNHGRGKQTADRYTPSPQRQQVPEQNWHAPNRLPKPPKQQTLTQNCPTPPHTRRRFFLSPKSLRSPFGHRAGRHSQENHVPLSGELMNWYLDYFCISVGPRVVAIDLHLNCVSHGPQCAHALHSQTLKIPKIIIIDNFWEYGILYSLYN